MTYMRIVRAGATAYDHEDGVVSHRILTCPPDECMPYNCRGHELHRKGIQGCGVDTETAPVGTTFTIEFVVMDHAVPPAVTRASRVIRVTSPCTPREVYCPDLPSEHACGSGACAGRASLVAVAPPAAQPPDLSFTTGVPTYLTASLDALNTTTALAPALAEKLNGEGVQEVVQVVVLCGDPLPIPLAACSAPAVAHACTVQAQQADGPVGAQGWEFSVTPLIDEACTSARMQAGECAACTAQAVRTGSCLPGSYAFLINARAPNGLLASSPVAAVVHVLATVATGAVVARVQISVQPGSEQPSEQAAEEVAAELAAAAGRVSEVHDMIEDSLVAALGQMAGSCAQELFGLAAGDLGVHVNGLEAAGEVPVQRTVSAGAAVLQVPSTPCVYVCMHDRIAVCMILLARAHPRPCLSHPREVHLLDCSVPVSSARKAVSCKHAQRRICGQVCAVCLRLDRVGRSPACMEPRRTS